MARDDREVFRIWLSDICRQLIAGLALVLVAALLILISARGGLAHDHHRPELDDWFKSLRSKANVPCCDGSDYKGIADPDWRSRDGKYQVRLKGEWRDVPDDAVIDTPNKVGQAMVWPVFYEDGTVLIRCFMAGALA